MIVAGIDLGLPRGAVPLLDGERVEIHDFTLEPKCHGRSQSVDARWLAELLREWHPECIMYEVTAARKRPLFPRGRAAGIVEGVAAVIGASVAGATPETVRQRCRVRKGRDADTIRWRAAELFPRRAPLLANRRDHRRARALLLAWLATRPRATPSRSIAELRRLAEERRP